MNGRMDPRTRQAVIMTLSRFPVAGEKPEAAAQRVVESSGAVFLGIQEAERNLVLLRHHDLPGSCIALRVDDVNELSVLLATSAQFLRYRKTDRKLEA